MISSLDAKTIVTNYASCQLAVGKKNSLFAKTTTYGQNV
jgi:hypothetical protein